MTNPAIKLLLIVAEGMHNKALHDLVTAKEEASNWKLSLPWNKDVEQIFTHNVEKGEAWCAELAALIKQVQETAER